MSKNLFFMSFTIFFISSCTFLNNLDKNFEKLKNPNLFINNSQSFLVNFETASEKIILEMLKYKNIFLSKKTLLFINPLENKTDTIMNEEKLTNIIQNEFLKNSNQITFIQNKIIKESKKKLGLSDTKDFKNNSAAILLSRNNHAQYYLYSCIHLKNKIFLLKMQLILVETGEIVFNKIEKFY